MEQEKIININSKELMELVKSKGKKLIYIGRSNCPGCLEMQPELSKVLRDKNISAYYYDTRRAREQELEDFYKIRENLNAHYIPLLLNINEDIEVERLDYNKFVESEDYVEEFVNRFQQQ